MSTPEPARSPSRALRPSRETVTTINQDGSRRFLHPADTRGRFTLLRRLTALLLIGIYILLPWIPIRGNPAVFLDVVNRRFHLFGLTFAAQDIWLAFFFITGLGFSLFVITALFGRLWCGWACPQTVFLEHVYRRIERWIEGDAPKRRKLDQATWDAPKIVKRVLKHGIFILLSILIAHILLAYFVSLPQLYQWVQTSPLEHWGAFLFVFVTAGMLYFNFAWFREQLCLIICPYGRLQSALIDDDSLVIGYDTTRGEPRGPAKVSGLGDCVDCLRCVSVCPTGIDIRQGLQIECVGCANCIDACDEIMGKLGRPRGLVRYDSFNGFADKPKRFFRPRLLLYALLMLAGAAAMTYSATRLGSANLSVVRMSGTPYIVSETGIRNQYLVRIINKNSTPRDYHLDAEASGQAIGIRGADEALSVPAMGEEVFPVVITVERDYYTGKFPLTLSIRDSQGQSLAHARAEFLGPDPRFLHEPRQNRKTSAPGIPSD